MLLLFSSSPYPPPPPGKGPPAYPQSPLGGGRPTHRPRCACLLLPRGVLLFDKAWRPCQIDALDPCALLMVIFAAVLGGFWLAFFIYRASRALSPGPFIERAVAVHSWSTPIAILLSTIQAAASFCEPRRSSHRSCSCVASELKQLPIM